MAIIENRRVRTTDRFKDLSQSALRIFENELPPQILSNMSLIFSPKMIKLFVFLNSVHIKNEIMGKLKISNSQLLLC